MQIRYAFATTLALVLLLDPVLAEPPARVAGFKAYLFSSKTGQLSPDVLAAGTELGNVPIGNYSSVSTLVVVRVELGPQSPVPANAQLRLLATESGAAAFTPGAHKAPNRVLLNALGKLGPVDDHGVTYVGFWLAGTGCRTIKLAASMSGTGLKVAPLTAVLPFTCYE